MIHPIQLVCYLYCDYWLVTLVHLVLDYAFDELFAAVRTDDYCSNVHAIHAMTDSSTQHDYSLAFYLYFLLDAKL